MPEIPLSGKNGKGLSTLVDEDDYEKYKDKKIYLSTDGYVFFHSKSTTVRFHRLIMDAPPNMFVDHINHDKLDNRKSVNLRLCTRQQNRANSNAVSGYKNVRQTPNGNWRVILVFEGEKVYDESFNTELEASHAADFVMIKYQGEFAKLNHEDFDYSGYHPTPRVVQRSSKYEWISYEKSNNTWCARLVFNKKVIYVGRYQTEEEAAMARDLCALKNNIDVPLLLPEYPYTLDMSVQTHGQKVKKNKYHGVAKTRNRYQARLSIPKQKPIHIGMFGTDVEAALAYDQYIKDNNIGHKELNFPEPGA